MPNKRIFVFASMYDTAEIHFIQYSVLLLIDLSIVSAKITKLINTTEENLFKYHLIHHYIIILGKHR